MKLLVLSNYFKGNSVSDERQSDTFYEKLSNFSIHISIFFLAMPLTSISAYGMIMTLLTDTSISDLSGSSYNFQKLW